MKLIKQNKDTNCAQTCIAMITGKDIQFIELLAGSDKGLFVKRIIPICKWLNIKIGKEWITIKWIGKYLLPLNCFVLVEFKNEKMGHLIIRNKGKFLDPNGTQYYLLPKRYKVKAYLKIK